MVGAARCRTNNRKAIDELQVIMAARKPIECWQHDPQTAHTTKVTNTVSDHRDAEGSARTMMSRNEEGKAPRAHLAPVKGNSQRMRVSNHQKRITTAQYPEPFSPRRLV